MCQRARMREMWSYMDTVFFCQHCNERFLYLGFYCFMYSQEDCICIIHWETIQKSLLVLFCKLQIKLISFSISVWQRGPRLWTPFLQGYSH